MIDVDYLRNRHYYSLACEFFIRDIKITYAIVQGLWGN